MILICGIPSEAPLAMVQSHLARMKVPFFCFNQRRSLHANLEFEVGSNKVGGELRVGKECICLEDVSGVYTRMMDEQLLPEMAGQLPASPARERAQAITIGLTNWMELAPARVVNRASMMASNDSKPLQGQMIRKYGFHLPETLITNDPEQVTDFRSRHQRIIFKSVSGARSIVRELQDNDLSRLVHVQACPVQFQEKLEGLDVRVHVVGTEIFATAAYSQSADYRYAAQDGSPARLLPYELNDDVALRCLQMTAGLGLLFSGIDLKFAPDGRVYCFEVNCCPGYSYFEANTGQPISLAIARLLAGRNC